MNKRKLLEEISDWQKNIEESQAKKIELERQILEINIYLNRMMARYNDLCEKLLKL